MKRSTRMASGTVCLVALALVMGWFVGQYVPAPPRMPEPDPYDALTQGTGCPVRAVVEVPFGKTARLAGVDDKLAALLSPRDASPLSDGETEAQDLPDMDMTVAETRVVSARSFVELYPECRQPGLDSESSAYVLATVVVRNVSDEPFLVWDLAATITLHGSDLAGIEESLGAGATLDAIAYMNVNAPAAGDVAKTPSDTPPPNPNLAPGSAIAVTLPFVISENALKDPSLFSDLDLSRWHIQTIDRETGTAWRFELA